jgi:prepilin signal peptidase PulO-like enzyme (type II secretory pathway)
MTGVEIFLVLMGAAAGYCIARAACWVARRQGDAGAAVAALPVVAAGALVALAAVLLGPLDLPLLCLTIVFGLCLLALAVIDLKTFILPDGLNLAVFLLGGVMVALFRQEVWLWHLAGAVAGYGLLWLVEVAYRKLRGIDGLGRGDAKLLGAIGMWVGLEGIPPVLLIASLGGIVSVMVAAVLRRQALSGQTAIAFGPWIALWGYAVWLAGPLF